MRIAVLVDLTPLCSKAVEYAGIIAEKCAAELILVHITGSSIKDKKTIEAKLNALGAAVSEKVKVNGHIESGSFFSIIPSIIADLSVDLIVVPTHGKVGLMQNLFGANILKLVKTLPVATLVVQEDSKLPSSGIDKLLFPIGPHSDFHTNYRQTASFAKLFNSTVIIYSVRNDIRGISDGMIKNIADSKTHFTEEGVRFEVINENPFGFSAGYAKYIVSYADQSDSNVICIMAKVSDDNGYIDNTDKENIILNNKGLPVLCTNSMA